MFYDILIEDVKEKTRHWVCGHGGICTTHALLRLRRSRRHEEDECGKSRTPATGKSAAGGPTSVAESDPCI